MRSRASIKGHPLHPILICFPVAFFIGALFFDILTVIFESDYWSYTSRVLNGAGVLTAIIAAVPGFIDYLYTIPPNSSAKKRGTYHMIVNLTGTAAFAVAYMLRESPPAITGGDIILLEAFGALFITVGGWLGGTLVYRNQIGVDHRYAEAGKWEERRFDVAAFPVNIGSMSDMKVNQMRLLVIGEKRVVLARTTDGFRAFSDHCTHKGGSLAGGTLIGNTVACPWHGSQFNVDDGSVCAGPAAREIDTYIVSERNGELTVDLNRESYHDEAPADPARIRDKTTDYESDSLHH